MNAKPIATLLATIVFATVAYAGEENNRKMEIKVVAEDGSDATYLTLDSDELGFNLHDLQVGEIRSIVDKEGRSILVTRGEENYSLNIDGKTIEIPAFDGHGDGMVWASKIPHPDAVDVDVHVMHDVTAPTVEFANDAVMISSGKEIDEATQQIIRTALESAGHENVRFADGDVGALHAVHVVKKVVEVEVTE